MSQSVIRRTESNVVGALGHSLMRRAWLPAEPQRVLLVVHGFAEHSGRYDALGAWFAERGSAVHAFDHQGHGRSGGRRCHVRRFDDFLDDLEVVHRAVVAEHPDLPLFAVGHSMGGLIVATWLRERTPEIAGAVLSGPALSFGHELPRLRMQAARWLRRLLPTLRVPAALDPNGLSRDPEVVRAYIEDPLVEDRLTLSLAAELFAAVQRTGAGGADVRVPVLILHGEQDPLCPVEASRRFHADLTSKGSALKTYPELRHEIFNEPEQQRVFADLQAWLEARAGEAH